MTTTTTTSHRSSDHPESPPPPAPVNNNPVIKKDPVPPVGCLKQFYINFIKWRIAVIYLCSGCFMYNCAEKPSLPPCSSLRTIPTVLLVVY